jgi:hypothetical protein
MIAPQPQTPAFIATAPPVLPAARVNAPFDMLRFGAEKAPVPANLLADAE